MRDVTVITGGAGGLGLATAKIVGRDRFVVLSDVGQDRLAAAVAELERLGVPCKAVACDITDRESVVELVETATEFGSVTSVVHTAGVSPGIGDAELIVRVDAIGTINVVESFYPLAREGFACVNVASVAA